MNYPKNVVEGPWMSSGQKEIVDDDDPKMM